MWEEGVKEYKYEYIYERIYEYMNTYAHIGKITIFYRSYISLQSPGMSIIFQGCFILTCNPNTY